MPARISNEQFIRKAKDRHGDRFDYSECRYVNATTKVDVACPEHGLFSVLPDVHTRKGSKGGCSKCAGNEKKTTEQFIDEAKAKHGSFYTYEAVKYVTARDYVDINCPRHGVFSQIAGEHLSGKGCQKCYDERRVQKYIGNADRRRASFIDRSKSIYGGVYDYQFAVYIDNRTPLQIICPVHQTFYQAPAVHLRGGGCPLCSRRRGGQKRRSDFDTFVRRAKEIHGDHYDYSNAIYTTNKSPLIIVCPTHGPFTQQPSNHLAGSGCKKCADIEKGIRKNARSRETIRDDFRAVHGDAYLYDKVDYVDSKTKVVVTCPTHGDFFVTPANHLFGHGCAECALERRPDYIDSRIQNDQEYANRTGFLYLLNVTHVPTGIKCLKIGLTSRTDPSARFRYARYENFEMQPYRVWTGKMRPLWEAERSVKQEIKSRSLLIDPFTEDYWHWTETFSAEVSALTLTQVLADALANRDIVEVNQA